MTRPLDYPEIWWIIAVVIGVGMIASEVKVLVAMGWALVIVCGALFFVGLL
jgi:hypothetical protein